MEYIHRQVEKNGKLYPIEIKMTTNSNSEMIKSFEVLNNIRNKNIGSGAIICNVDSTMKIKDD